MSLGTLASIAGMPGMDLAVSAAVDLVQTIQNVKLYKRQAAELSDSCTKLLLAYRDACEGLEGTEFTSAADEITEIVERASRKARTWANMNKLRSLVHQSEIKDGIDSLYKDIDACAQHFSIATSSQIHRSQREMALMRERDAAENREALRTLLENVENLREVLQLPQPNVQDIMLRIQEELQQPSVQPEQRDDLRESLLEIHRETKILPPGIELTGQVQKTSNHPVAYGGYNDVYTGLWLGHLKVALRFARALNHSTKKAQKRFEHEVELWKDLQHPHVCRLYGIAEFDGIFYSVSEWMDNSDALSYINSTEEVIDRARLLMDVQWGMEYLHLKNVVHGDLRAANVLIDSHGKACISDFGLAKVIEDVAPELVTSSHHGDTPIRWQARELVTPNDGHSLSVSTATDVWSYGMLCLEIMTGQRPYAHRKRDGEVISDLLAKKLPQRPMDDVVVARGLSDDLWQMMLFCWSWDASQRPSMTNIRTMMEKMTWPVSNPVPRPSPKIPSNILSESPVPIHPQLSPIIHRPTLPATVGGGPSVLSSRTSSIPHAHHIDAIQRNKHTSPPPATAKPSAADQVRRPRRSPSSTSPVEVITHSGGNALDLNLSPSSHARQARKGSSTSSLGCCPTTESPGKPNRADSYSQPSLHLLPPDINVDSGDNDGLLASQSDGEVSVGSLSSSLPSSTFSPLHGDRTSSVSIESVHSPSNPLLNWDGLHCSSVIQKSPSNAVLAGSLAGLVDELLRGADNGYRRDERYQQVFLTNYRLFSGSEEPSRDFLRLLLRRYTLAEGDPAMRVEVRVATRHEILDCLKKLLLRHYSKAVDDSTLRDLLQFLRNIRRPSSFVGSAKELILVVENLIRASEGIHRQRSATISSAVERPVKHANIKPAHLAFAMMLAEGVKYRNITPTDCVSYLLNQDGDNAVSEAREMNNKIVNWVKRAILRSDRLSDRGDTLEFFVNTALECHKLHNFSSMSAILAAVNSSTVSRLRLTKECLSKPALDVQEKLSKILDPAHNHRAYRELLPDSSKSHCVPWLAVHLKDLKSTYLRHDDDFVKDQQRLINFEKYVRLSDGIDVVLRYQDKRNTTHSNLITFEPLSYLEEKLANTHLDVAAEDKLEARSLELQAQEDSDLTRRVNEWNSVGFKTKSSGLSPGSQYTQH